MPGILYKTSAAKGGDLGWIPENALIPPMLGVVPGLAEGDISAPVQAQDGWHIVKAIATKPAGPRPLAEVRATIVDALRQQAADTAAAKLVDDLLSKKDAAVNMTVLKAAITENVR